MYLCIVYGSNFCLVIYLTLLLYVAIFFYFSLQFESSALKTTIHTHIYIFTCTLEFLDQSKKRNRRCRKAKKFFCDKSKYVSLHIFFVMGTFGHGGWGF